MRQEYGIIYMKLCFFINKFGNNVGNPYDFFFSFDLKNNICCFQFNISSIITPKNYKM